MKRPSFVVSLATDKNDYQREQGTAVQEAARRMGAEVTIVYAENDAITQSQQLLSVIQSKTERPDGIICFPVGSGLAQVASAAVACGIGWSVLREVEYLGQLRRNAQVPVFCVSVDQEEVGRIQGRQLVALAPQEGIALYLMGPAVNPGVELRGKGMMATKPANLQVRTLRGRWTEESGYEAVNAWLRLSTSHQTPIAVVASQNDNMAIGARKAFDENTTGEERERWARVPYTGCDALRSTGQEWVRKGLLAASVLIPPTAGTAVELFVRALQNGSQPPERTLSAPSSFPPVEKLAGLGHQAAAQF